MLDKLDRDSRMRLMKLVCSLAGADVDVREEEVDLIRKLVDKLGLDADETEQVQAWLLDPPAADALEDVPAEHRELFVRTAREIAIADGEISEDEQQHLAFLELLANKR